MVSHPKPVYCGHGGDRSRWVSVVKMGQSCGSVVGCDGCRRLVVVAAGHGLVVVDRVPTTGWWPYLGGAALPFPL
jgi:hypothetical protein